MDPTAIIGTVVSEASSLASTGLNNWFNRQANEEARQYGQEMAAYAYNKDLEQWNRANEYNLPSNQMARLREAGLNPMLMYQQGNVGNAQQAAPRYSVPQGRFGGYNFPPSNAVDRYMDLKMKSQQIDNLSSMKQKLDEEVKIKKADAIIRGLEAGLKPDQIKFLMQEMDFKRSLFPYQKESWDLRNKAASKNLDILTEKLGLTQSQAKWALKRIDEFERSGLDIQRAPWYMNMWNAATKGLFNRGEGGGRLPGKITWEDEKPGGPGQIIFE